MHAAQTPPEIRPIRRLNQCRVKNGCLHLNKGKNLTLHMSTSMLMWLLPAFFFLMNM